MQNFLYDEFGVEVSIPTIHCVLKKSQWSQKATSHRAAERSMPLRKAWEGIQKKYEADQLIFLDESAANERTSDRKFGWSPIGLICEQSRPIKRSKRWSILPALTIEGYLDYIIFQGSITTEIFNDFIEDQVLPHCNPYPSPQLVLILDNASIHKNIRL
jgi:DDE superfamily endonuclease